MNLFNYLMAKKGHNTSVRDDLLAYLLGKRPPKEVKTATGTTISITDVTREKIVSLTLSKESTQDGTPTPENPVEIKTVIGYRNLFDKDNALIGYEINGSDGTVSPNNGYYTSDFIPVKANENYYLQKEINIEGASNCFYDINHNFISTLRQNVGVITIPDNNNIAYMRFNGKIIQENVQLTEGTEELPYVPYGTNYVYAKVVGKNLFDKNAIIDNYALNRNNNILIPGSNFATSDYCQVKPNTNYYLGLYYSSSSYGILFYDKDKNWLSSISPANTFETPNNTYFIRFSWNKNNFDANEIQLEQGTQATSYEPYKENIITIPLNGNEIAGIGDYKDELIIDKNGHCWLNKKMVTKQISSTDIENYIDVSQGSLFRSYSFNDIITSIFTTKCNYYLGIVNATSRQNYNVYWNSPVRCFDFIDNRFNNLEDFKNWVDTVNLKVLGILNEPQLIDLNYTVDLTLFEGVNNISNSEDMNMTLKYY